MSCAKDQIPTQFAPGNSTSWLFRFCPSSHVRASNTAPFRSFVPANRELRHLLTRELGILMRGEEMRRLVDAFGTTEVTS